MKTSWPAVRGSSVNLNSLVKTRMKRGKLAIADKVIASAKRSLRAQGYSAPSENISTALHRLSPVAGLRREPAAGQVRQAPAARTISRQEGMGLRWMATQSRSSAKLPVAQRNASKQRNSPTGEGLSSVVMEVVSTRRVAEAHTLDQVTSGRVRARAKAPRPAAGTTTARTVTPKGGGLSARDTLHRMVIAARNV